MVQRRTARELLEKHYQHIVDHYNQKNMQDTTNMTPDDAVKPENENDVKTNLEIRQSMT